METVSLCCQSAHQGKCSPALSGILWLSLASLDLMVIRKRCDKKVADFQSRREEIMMMTVVIMFSNDSSDDDDNVEDDEMAGGMKLAF